MIKVNVIEYDEKYWEDVKQLAELVFKGKRDAYWASRWINKCDKAFLAFINKKLVGVVELGYIKLSSGLHSQIGYIFVHPNYRRKGIATRLISESINYLGNQGAIGVWAVTGKNNDAAIALFEKNGFMRYDKPKELEKHMNKKDIKKLLWKLYYEESDIIFHKKL